MASFFKDLEVLWIARFDYKSDWILSPHAHKDFYQIVYFIDGSCTVVIDGKKEIVPAPRVLFFSPNVKHGFIKITTKRLKTLDIKFRIHSKKLSGYCKKIPAVISVNNDDIYDLLEKIRLSGSARELFFEEECQLLLGKILIDLLRTVQGNAEKPLPDFSGDRENLHPVTARVYEFIKNHYQEKIDAAFLEANLHYSYRYLSGHFRREMNMTPVEFAEVYKISKAKEFLKNTEFEIKYISEILKYPSVHQFSRSFKKVTGVPPGEWRNTAYLDIGRDIIIQPGFENTLFIKKNSG